MNNNKVVLYIATSLDGYIARRDGSVDWLDHVEVGEGDGGYSEFYSTVGTIVMGRMTYDEVLILADVFPYADKPCYVLSRSKQASTAHVTFTDESINTLIPRLKGDSKGDIWLVGGGQLAAAFLQEGLLDELHIAIIPTILGEGIPLFQAGVAPTNLHLMKVDKFEQMVSLIYKVNNN